MFYHAEIPKAALILSPLFNYSRKINRKNGLIGYVIKMKL